MKIFTFLACILSWLVIAQAQKRVCIPKSEVQLESNLQRYVVDSDAQVAMPLNLATSERISHRLTTAIFKIFLEEVVGYQDVNIVTIEDTLRPAQTLSYLYSSSDSMVMEEDYFTSSANMSFKHDFTASLSPVLEAAFEDPNILRNIKEQLYPTKTNAPHAMINLELWLSPGFSDYEEQSNPPVSCGTQGTGGRFGWYLPHSTMDNNSYITDHWRSFRSENITRIFHLSARELHEIKTRFTVTPSGNHYCPDEFEGEPMCSEGIYVPLQCQQEKLCATLFAGKFAYSSFVAHQILDQQLLVQVAWIGPNLTPDFVLNFRRNKRLMFISWWPSPLTVLDGYVRIAFPSCNELNSEEVNNYLCKYELHTLTKQAWYKLQDFGDLAYKTLERFSLDDDDYQQLLVNYNRRTILNDSQSLVVVDRVVGWDDHIIDEIACGYLNNLSQTRAHHLTYWAPVGYNKKPIMWVAGIFPLTFSPGRYSSKTLIHAAAFAEMDINRNKTFLPDYTLQIQFENGQCKSDGVLYAFIKYIRMASCDNSLKINQMVGILGPGCSDTVEPLAGISKLMNTTLMSYSAEGAIFYDQGKYPFFFRTIPENKMYRHVYLQLFKELEWRQIASLTEDGNKYSEYLTLLQDSLQLENSTNVTIFNKKFPKRIRKDMATYLELLRDRSYRIIIGDFYADLACEVMCEAFKLRMTLKYGFVWFLPSWFTPKWYDVDNSKMKEHIACSTKDLLEALDGHFALGYAYYAPDSQILHSGDTVKDWRKRYRDTFDNTEPADYGGYTYDAVWTYAFALDKLIKEDLTHVANMHSARTSQRFVQLLRETNFTGVSGHIQFGEGPSRQTAVVNILQFRVDYVTQNGSYQTVGNFYPNPDKNGGKLTMDRDSITWFTEDNSPPHDGRRPMSNCILYSFSVFLGVQCEMAILIAFLFSIFIFTMLIVMIYIVYKSKYDKLKQPPIWTLAELDEWEIPRERVVINRTIGEGAFGTVFGGECMIHEGGGWDAVAVKTLKVGSNDSDKVDFLSEADMMKRLNHENIINLLGLSTRQQPFYMIMEFMLYGDLKNYLLSRRHLVSERTMFNDDDEISNKRLTSMAYDVAKGLEYLAVNKYVHRDVACRNCLVNAARTVKLSDFGMTRPMHDTNYYRFFRKGMLPVRWMSPESIDEQLYTTKTDVWSYGVLLYEVITFGNFPFQGMSNYEVLDYVKKGNTIKPPQGVRPALERLLYQCWNFNPNNRPSFSDIVRIFRDSSRLIMPCLDLPGASVHNNLPDNLGGAPEPNRWQSTTAPTKSMSKQPNCNSSTAEEEEGGTSGRRTAPLIIDPENPTVFSSNSVITTTFATPHDIPLRDRRGHAENGKFSAMEPLLPITGDSYIARYACLQLSRSPDNAVESECPFPSLTSV